MPKIPEGILIKLYVVTIAPHDGRVDFARHGRDGFSGSLFIGLVRETGPETAIRIQVACDITEAEGIGNRVGISHQ